MKSIWTCFIDEDSGECWNIIPMDWAFTSWINDGKRPIAQVESEETAKVICNAHNSEVREYAEMYIAVLLSISPIFSHMIAAGLSDSEANKEPFFIGLNKAIAKAEGRE